jgi:hypothetical protein
MERNKKMKNDFDKELSKKYCHRFGEIAVRKGFVTAEQAKEALTEQIDDDINNRRHRLIGEILFMNGWINIKQLEIVLNELYKNKRENQKVS